MHLRSPSRQSTRPLLRFVPLSIALALATACGETEDALAPAAAPDSTSDDILDTSVEPADSAAVEVLGPDTPDTTEDDDTVDASESVDASEPVDASLPPNPCPLPPGRGCSPTGAPGPWVSAAPKTIFQGAFTCEASVSEEPACATGTCSFGDCVDESDAIPAGVPIHFVSSLVVTDPDCCFDVDGKKGNDNAIGKNMEATWFQFGQGSFDAEIVSSIQRGYYAIAFAFEEGEEARMWFVRTAGEKGPNAFPSFPPPPETTRVASPRAYVPGTSVPLSQAAIPKVGEEEWATTTPLPVLVFPVSLGPIHAEIPVRQAQLRVRRDGDTFQIELGGQVYSSDFLASLSAYFATDCACWGLEGDILGLSEQNPETPLTNPNLALTPEAECPPAMECGDNALIAATGALADLALGDLDVDGNGLIDAMSLGFKLSTVPISGLSLPPVE